MTHFERTSFHYDPNMTDDIVPVISCPVKLEKIYNELTQEAKCSIKASRPVADPVFWKGGGAKRR